jgi:hypothetical protein
MKINIGVLIFSTAVIILLAHSNGANGQQKSPPPPVKGYLVGYKIEGRDTVYQINIRELYVFNRPERFKKSRSWREFARLVYNFRKVYPYALRAKDKILEADSIMTAKNLTGKARDRYIKIYEDKLFAEFEKPLRKMTITQGKLLLKLIDREVGQSSYYLIKTYKGGFTAFFWQGIARIFGSDLKSMYDPYGSDRAVEELVQMYKEGSFDSLYYSMYNY